MKHVYPIVMTQALKECREFYVKALDATVLFQQDWYVHLAVDGWEIGFLRPNHPMRLPVFQHTTVTRGLCLAIEVHDVQQVHDDMLAKGIELFGPLRTFPSGEKSFSVMDPAGLVLNVVERDTAGGEVLEI